MRVGADPAAGRAEAQAARNAAAGWLRLEGDQREAGESRSPETRMRQQSLEWQEAIRYRQLLQDQERDLQMSRRQERTRGAPGEAARIQGRLMEMDAAQQQQRLRMRMERTGRTRDGVSWPRTLR